MTTPSWILLIAPTVALAIGVITVWAALIGNRRTNATALQNAQLASYTTFEASCTKDRLDTVTRFIDAIAEVLDDPRHKTKDKVWSEFHRIQVAFHPGGAPVDVAREMRDTVVDLMTHDEVKPAAGVEALGNAASIDALERGRADFVAAAGEWVNNPPALRKARNGIEARSLPPGSSRR